MNIAVTCDRYALSQLRPVLTGGAEGDRRSAGRRAARYGVTIAAGCHRSCACHHRCSKAAIVVGVLMSLVLAGGGVANSYSENGQGNGAAPRGGSQPMCRLIAAKPRVLADPAFDWPALNSSIPAYVDAVAAYSTWRTHSQQLRPPGSIGTVPGPTRPGSHLICQTPIRTVMFLLVTPKVRKSRRASRPQEGQNPVSKRLLFVV